VQVDSDRTKVFWYRLKTAGGPWARDQRCDRVEFCYSRSGPRGSPAHFRRSWHHTESLLWSNCAPDYESNAWESRRTRPTQCYSQPFQRALSNHGIWHIESLTNLRRRLRYGPTTPLYYEAWRCDARSLLIWILTGTLGTHCKDRKSTYPQSGEETWTWRQDGNDLTSAWILQGDWTQRPTARRRLHDEAHEVQAEAGRTHS